MLNVDDKNDFLAAALNYAQRGWPVFPLVPGQKPPLTSNGFKAATLDSTKITAWWKKYPQANIGVATGTVSGIVVVDVDDMNGFTALQKLLHPIVTSVSRTQSGGLHLFYRHPGVPVSNRVKFMPGIDLRGDGGYIVAPPSVVNGRRYEFISNHEIPPIPDKLMRVLSGLTSYSEAKDNHAPQLDDVVCHETDDLECIGDALMSAMKRQGAKKSCARAKPSQIISARKKAGLTQTQAAELVCTTCRVWQQWEAGDRRMHPGFWLLFQSQLQPRRNRAAMSSPCRRPSSARCRMS